MAKDVKFVCLDESVNAYGFRVIVSGVDISQFERNPVLLYDHRDWGLPPGRWENLKIEDGKIVAVPIFDETDVDAKKLKEKVENNFVRMASVGLVPIEWSDAPELMLPGQTQPTLTKCRLREISITAFGANHNALVLYDNNGSQINLHEISTNLNIDKKMDLKIIAGALNLTEKASEAEVVKAVLDLKEEKTKLSTRVETLEKEKQTLSDKIENSEKDVLLNAAVAEKKITEKEKTVLIKLSVEDIKIALADRKAAVNLQNFTEDNPDSEIADLAKLSWQELDMQGKLVILKEKNFETFKTKFKERFGKEYK